LSSLLAIVAEENTAIAGDPLVHWVVNAVLAAVLGFVGFFARKAFAGVEDAVKAMTSELRSVQATIASQNTAVALQEVSIEALKDENRAIREDLRVLSERIRDLELARRYESGIREGK